VLSPGVHEHRRDVDASYAHSYKSKEAFKEEEKWAESIKDAYT
jgi:hypothetical protein